MRAIKAALHPYKRRIFETFNSDAYSFFANNELDKKLAKYLYWRNGTFIEAGAYDGLFQSNTYWFERFRGWRGILVEAVPEMAAKAAKNRPKAQVYQACLVASTETKTMTVGAAGPYGYVIGSMTPEHEPKHRAAGAQHLGNSQLENIEVPARTLEAILDDARIGPIDLFSLDVENYEIPVLAGMNVKKYRPEYLLIETGQPKRVLETLEHRYEVIDRFGESDVLFKRL